MPDLKTLLGDRWDDLVERAARAAYEAEGDDTDPAEGFMGWDRLAAEEPAWADGWRTQTSHALAEALSDTAVLPDLLAAAWDEGYKAGHRDAVGVRWPDPAANPYREQQ